MRVIEIGDMGFFCHSLKEKSIVGIVQVIAKAHADSTTDDPRWECVDIKAVSAVGTPVTLQEIKSHPELEDMVLVNNSRLSVQPVTQAQWETVYATAQAKL